MNTLNVLKDAERVSTSTMSGKMKYIDAINTSPADNDFCMKMTRVKNSICGDCYSQRTMKMYPTARRRMSNNGRLLSEGTIDPLSVALGSPIVRLSAHGELINQKHLKNLMSIVNAHPARIFTLWTKRKNIATNYFSTHDKPENLILIYSSKSVNIRESKPKFFDKVFTVYSKEFLGIRGNKPDASAVDISINCGSKSCNDCRKCYTKTDPDIFINEIKK